MVSGFRGFLPLVLSGPPLVLSELLLLQRELQLPLCSTFLPGRITKQSGARLSYEPISNRASAPDLAAFGISSCTRKGFQQLKLQETPFDAVLRRPSGGTLLCRHCKSLQTLNQSATPHGGNGGMLNQQAAMPTCAKNSCTTGLIHLLEAGP